MFQEINNSTEELLVRIKEWDSKIAFFQNNKKRLKESKEVLQ